jgi:hypothetical protein
MRRAARDAQQRHYDDVCLQRRANRAREAQARIQRAIERDNKVRPHCDAPRRSCCSVDQVVRE